MIGYVISNILTTSQEIRDLVGDNIFALFIDDEEAVLPAIVYSVGKIEPDYSKQFLISEDISVDIVIFSKDYKNALDIASQVRLAFERRSGEICGQNISDIVISSIDEKVDILEKVYVITITIDITKTFE